MDMTPWDFVAQQFANLGAWVLAQWIPLMSFAVLLIIIGWFRSEIKRAPNDPDPEPLYPPPAQVRRSVDRALEEWGKLAEQDQKRKEADAALQRKVDEIVEAAWAREDRT